VTLCPTITHRFFALGGGHSWRVTRQRLPNIVNATLRTVGIGLALQSVWRPWIAPLGHPAVSSQFGTPGSLAETTTRRTPSRTTHACEPWRLLRIVVPVGCLAKVTLFKMPDSGHPDRCLVGISLILLGRAWSKLDVQVVVCDWVGDPFKAWIFRLVLELPGTQPSALVLPKPDSPAYCVSTLSLPIR